MYLNFVTDHSVKVEAVKDANAKRVVEVINTTRLKLGSICGHDKDYPIAVNYVLDEETNKIIVVSTSNYATPYRSLIGRMFESVDKLKATCLRVYTPPYLD